MHSTQGNPTLHYSGFRTMPSILFHKISNLAANSSSDFVPRVFDSHDDTIYVAGRNPCKVHGHPGIIVAGCGRCSGLSSQLATIDNASRFTLCDPRESECRVESNSILSAIPGNQSDGRRNPSFVLFVFFVVKSFLQLNSRKSQDY